MRFVSLVATLALIAPFAIAADGVKEVGAQLRHAENDMQPNAHGGVGIRTGSDFERFSVGVEGVSELVTLKVQLGDGHDHFLEIGTLASGLSHRNLELTTREGGHLPFGAAHVADLIGRGIHVVDGDGHLILVGEVPHFAVVVPPPVVVPPSADLLARNVMTRPEHSPYDDSRGVIVALRHEGHEALRLEVGHLAPQTAYAVFLGDHDGPIDTFTTNGEGGALIVHDTGHGGELPGGAASLADLAGRHIEIRHEHDVVLIGAIPHLEDHHAVEPVHEVAEHHDEASGANVHVEVAIHPEQGHEQFRMDMRDLPVDHVQKAAGKRAKADVFMADGTGTMQQVASVRIDRKGRAHLRYNTRRGDALPLGAATLRELSARAFEVRVNGVKAVGGNLPTF